MNLTTKQIISFLDLARERVPVKSLWQHYKGGQYEILGHTLNTETGMIDVRYHRVGGPSFDPAQEQGIEFTRPFEAWYEGVDGVPRFQRLTTA